MVTVLLQLFAACDVHRSERETARAAGGDVQTPHSEMKEGNDRKTSQGNVKSDFTRGWDFGSA